MNFSCDRGPDYYFFLNEDALQQDGLANLLLGKKLYSR
jgi:hypothetical protein